MSIIDILTYTNKIKKTIQYIIFHQLLKHSPFPIFYM